MGGQSSSQDKLVYNIRKAVPQDFPKILPMAEAFYNTTTHVASIPFDFDSVLDYYLMMLDLGFILVAENEGELVGMIGCFVQPFLLNKNYKMCTEAMWYVTPDHRAKTVARELMVSAEEEAEALGCDKMVMSALSTSPTGIDAYYKRRGYELSETAYVKEI